MLFMIPGLEETMRVSRTASISTDSEIRNLCTDGIRVPNSQLSSTSKPVSCIVERRCDDQTCGISQVGRLQMSDNGAELLAAHIDEAEHVDAITEGYRQLCALAEVRNFSSGICCFETQISVIAYSHDLQIRPSAIHNRGAQPGATCRAFRSEGEKITRNDSTVLAAS